MTGIEIISKIPIKERMPLGYDAVAIYSLILLIITIMAIVRTKRIQCMDLTTAMYFCFALVVIVAFGIADTLNIQDTGRYLYECRISDEVSISEICTKYNIVKYENGIYTIEDKEG